MSTWFSKSGYSQRKSKVDLGGAMTLLIPLREAWLNDMDI